MPCEYANISVEPLELVFEYEESSPFTPPKQTLKVKKVMGGGTLTPRWSATINCDWVTMSRMSGVASSTSIIISVKAKQKAVGEHLAIITIYSDTAENAPQYAFVKLIVTGDIPEPEIIEYPFQISYNTHREVNKEIPVPGGEPEKSWFIRFIEWIIDFFKR